ncbi:MAG: Xaa-Pro aminopeptidase [Acidobacteria bacterium]|nr:Xaa-Pro aminopeptidase [Acidobacteriota bacterium]
MQRPQLAEFIKRLPENSVAIIPGSLEATRSNDTHYRYRQSSDFLYLTGFDEPESIAVIAPSREQKYTLFVRPRDPEREIWDGLRAGVEGAKEKFGADEAFPVEEFRDKLTDILNDAAHLYYRIGDGNPELDQAIINQIARMRAMGRRGITPPQSIVDPGTILHEMRLIKTDEEIELMQRAADIAAEAHRMAMQESRPGVKEYVIEALIEYHFRRSGASAPAYSSIVGGGANATILHYINNDAELRDGDLLLIDAGAEYQGYASDITRTFPVNGRFTEAQRDIYELVLEAQTACIEMTAPGVTMDELHDRSVEILTEGMVRLGLLQGEVKQLIEEEKYKQFYMHRLGHFLGMDVHDVGRYQINGQARPLEPGVVITIEPGIYIAADTKDIPETYLGIGVRIEDDVLVTGEGNRVLTDKAPKEVKEIEELMEKSKATAA